MESFFIDGKEFKPVVLGRQLVGYGIAEDGTVVRTISAPGTRVGKILKPYPRGAYLGWQEATVTLPFREGGKQHKVRVSVNSLVRNAWHPYKDDFDPLPIEPIPKLRRPRGEEHWHAVLSEEDVTEIRRIWKSTRKHYGVCKSLAERYNVSRRWIYEITHGDTYWQHILGED